MKSSLILVCIVLFPCLVLAEPGETEKLLLSCDGTNKNTEYCLGQFAGYRNSMFELITVYARGYADGTEFAGLNKNDFINAKTIDISYNIIINTYGCIQDQTDKDLAEAFVKWVKDNPSYREKSLIFTVRQAFLQYFPPPCKVWE